MVIESAVIVLVGISNAVGVQYSLPTNQLKTFTASVVFGALVNIVLNLPLILLIQSNGAMVATVLSELLVTVYQLIKVRKQIHIFKLFAEVWKYAFSAVVMGVLVRIFTVVVPVQSVTLLLLAVLWGGAIYFLILGLLRPHVLIQMILVLKRKSK